MEKRRGRARAIAMSAHAVSRLLHGVPGEDSLRGSLSVSSLAESRADAKASWARVSLTTGYADDRNRPGGQSVRGF